MNFEDLQKSWQGQPVAQPADISRLRSGLETHWNKYQHKLLRTNLCMSLGFSAACIAIGWVYFSYRKEFSWPFDFSIGATYLLMFIYLAVVWRSYAFKKENMEDSSTGYIGYQLKKLHWQRRIITTYSWIYAVLLWLALICYMWEITAPGTALFRYTAIGISTAYIVAVNAWYRLKKQNKQLKVIDHITADLERLRKELTD